MKLPGMNLSHFIKGMFLLSLINDCAPTSQCVVSGKYVSINGCVSPIPVRNLRQAVGDSQRTLLNILLSRMKTPASSLKVPCPSTSVYTKRKHKAIPAFSANAKKRGSWADPSNAFTLSNGSKHGNNNSRTAQEDELLEIWKKYRKYIFLTIFILLIVLGNLAGFLFSNRGDTGDDDLVQDSNCTTTRRRTRRRQLCRRQRRW